MCVYSAMGPIFEPLIPSPWDVSPVVPTIIPTGPVAPECEEPRSWLWGPVPNTGAVISPAQLRALLDAFWASVRAAKAADAAAGQPDCVDESKVKLEARVRELERRLDEIEKDREASKERVVIAVRDALDR